MANNQDFVARLERKVEDQLCSVRVGFLLGAGSSYLDGTGYPLAGALWPAINHLVPKYVRDEIQQKLDEGANGIENALDLLDRGEVDERPHRHLVATAIAEHFGSLSPPLDIHSRFVTLLSQRNERHVSVFSLNYDPLVERAAELAQVRVLDGFYGHEHAYFDAGSFQHDIAVLQLGARGGARRRKIAPWIWLIKLHGSLGWYENDEAGIRRMAFDAVVPDNAKRLMIPPQHRKANEIVYRPYTALWSEFRSRLVHQADALNRLVTLGYGMADEHVNDVIEGAMARNNFSLIIISRSLSDEAFDRWAQRKNAVIVTQERSALCGEIGAGHPTLWSFEAVVGGLDR
ncbi:MAG: SIR2 family protein [Alphaproteobacteria bacterium]|nr:SIR2 family protein [Alphaproteobacteria bacterium]